MFVSENIYYPFFPPHLVIGEANETNKISYRI